MSGFSEQDIEDCVGMWANCVVFLGQMLMQGKGGSHYASVFQQYQQKAEFFMCSCLGKGTRNIQKTPGGLLFRQRWNNMQFVTSASFLLTVYSDYLSSAGKNLNCASGSVSPAELLSFAKSQVIRLIGGYLKASPSVIVMKNEWILKWVICELAGGLYSW